MKEVVHTMGDSDYSLSDQKRWDAFVLKSRIEHLEELQKQLTKLTTSGEDFWHEAVEILGNFLETSSVAKIVLKILESLGVKEAEMPEKHERKLLLLMMIALALEQKQLYIELNEIRQQMHALMASRKPNATLHDSTWALDEGSIFDDASLRPDDTTIGKAEGDTKLESRPAEVKSRLRERIEEMWSNFVYVDPDASPETPEEWGGI